MSQQCFSALSNRKQRWQELELPSRSSIREKLSRSNWSASNALTSSSSKKTAEKQDEEEDGIKKYDSPSDNGDIPSLEQEADFHLARGSRFVRSILLNSRIVFSCFVFIFHVMKLWDCHHLLFLCTC